MPLFFAAQASIFGMVHESPHTRFNASRLVRVLTDLAGTDASASKQPFADRLGQWLSLADALALYSALNANPAEAPAAPAPPHAPEGDAMRKAFERVRGALAASIRADDVLANPGARRAPPAPAAAAMDADEADFAPWLRRYLAHQRDMSAKIAPLRATLRSALARRSPALQRLAALDAVLDQALAARERDLLATVPALLQRRFEQLRDAQRAADGHGDGHCAAMDTSTPAALTPSPSGASERGARTGAPRNFDAGTGAHLPATAGMPAGASAAAGAADQAMQPDAWLAAFGGQMQGVLLAELELRLQPAAGLIAALENEGTSKQ